MNDTKRKKKEEKRKIPAMSQTDVCLFLKFLKEQHFGT